LTLSIPPKHYRCDEGCNAYIFAELEDAATGDVIPGYERTSFATLTDVDSIDLMLQWTKTTNTAAPSTLTLTDNAAAPAGTRGGERPAAATPFVAAAALAATAAAAPSPASPVRLRLFFRDATIYSVVVAN
jgi:hypothetical protein